MAEVVVFAASDTARYMTGSKLVVDGDLTIGGIPQIYAMLDKMRELVAKSEV